MGQGAFVYPPTMGLIAIPVALFSWEINSQIFLGFYEPYSVTTQFALLVQNALNRLRGINLL
jgi:hypothetical protein